MASNYFNVKNGIYSPVFSGETLIVDTLTASTIYGVSAEHQITKDFSGFVGQNDGNDDIDVSYDSTERTITLTGTFKLYYQGSLILDVVASSWTSDPHPSGVTTTQFLKFNGGGFQWQETPWNFHEAQIAYVCIKSTGEYCFSQREPHGLGDWETHEQLHFTIGSVLRSGGDLSDYTLNSTTAANRRPLINATTVVDEDLHTIIPALTAETYTRFSLSSTTTVNFTTASNDIVNLSTNQPYYNQWNGSAWVQTLMSNNNYQAIFVIAIPTTSDSTAQAHRYLFVQGQTQNSSLTTIQAITTNNLTLGDFTNISPEFTFIAKIIIRYTGGNWQLIQVDKLTGNKVSQLSTPSGSYLSSVASKKI